MCCSSGNAPLRTSSAYVSSASRATVARSAYRLTKRGARPCVEAEQVVPDEHLAVALRAGADADRRDVAARSVIRAATGGGTHSSTSAKQPASSSASASSNSCRACSADAALRLEAAEHRRRLRRQPDVAHHGNARADERPHPRQHRPRALDLHGVGAGFLDEADAFSTAGSSETWKEPNGMSRDDERPPRAARHRARQHDHLVHRRRHGRGVAEHGHRRRVADEDDVHAGLVGQAAARRVVRRDHDDPLAALLHLHELGQRELARGGRGGCGLTRPGAHELSSSSRTTLSMRRMAPTRTAAARTGGSKGRPRRSRP